MSRMEVQKYCKADYKSTNIRLYKNAKQKKKNTKIANMKLTMNYRTENRKQ